MSKLMKMNGFRNKKTQNETKRQESLRHFERNDTLSAALGPNRA
jgi:hypothetical protein